MKFQPILGIPILFIALGMGIVFSLPIAVATFSLKKEPTASCTINLEKNWQRASMVFTGTVEGVLDDAATADVWMAPITWYKGKQDVPFVRFTADIATSSTKGASTGVLTSGQTTYLLFLRKSAGGAYRTSPCFGTRVLGSGLTTAEKKLLAP